MLPERTLYMTSDLWPQIAYPHSMISLRSPNCVKQLQSSPQILHLGELRSVPPVKAILSKDFPVEHGIVSGGPHGREPNTSVGIGEHLHQIL